MSEGFCFECNNLGTVECECGGDICVCANNGEMPCPACDGGRVRKYEGEDDDDFDCCHHGIGFDEECEDCADEAKEDMEATA